MSLFFWLNAGSGRLEGRRVYLRRPKFPDHAQWAALRQESRTFLEPWEPEWLDGELSPASWRRRMRQYRADERRGTGQNFFIFERNSDCLAGGISLMNIRRGVSQSTQIGYWMGERFAGRGYMGEALALIRDYCFNSLHLHRIEAACIPENRRSAHVLEKAGFIREGTMRSYLRINGEWQDHILYALIAGDEGMQPKRDAGID